jgi:hypothetical protein
MMIAGQRMTGGIEAEMIEIGTMEGIYGIAPTKYRHRAGKQISEPPGANTWPANRASQAEGEQGTVGFADHAVGTEIEHLADEVGSGGRLFPCPMARRTSAERPARRKFLRFPALESADKSISLVMPN